MNIRVMPIVGMNDQEIKALTALDRRIFPYESDVFDEELLGHLRGIGFLFFLIMADDVIAGSIHLGPNFVWEEEFPSPSPGDLYIASTGILPEFRKKGIATFTKQWQIDYARSHGFKRIIADCRKSRFEMIRINLNHGLRIVGEIPGFYEDPAEPAVHLELTL